jgi:hypothetical protein
MDLDGRAGFKWLRKKSGGGILGTLHCILDSIKEMSFFDQLIDYKLLIRDFASVRQNYIEPVHLCHNFQHVHV